jgi:hypothetical protein
MANGTTFLLSGTNFGTILAKAQRKKSKKINK